MQKLNKHSRRGEFAYYTNERNEVYGTSFQGFLDGRAILLSQDPKIIEYIRSQGNESDWLVQIAATPEQVTFEDGTHPEPE